jgi:hypothetical protein
MVRISLAALALAAALAAVAPASSARELRIASYCSPSGDVCYGIIARQGVVRFELTTAARYFNRYLICVRPPTGAAACKSFPVVARGQAFGGVVRWARNFPNRGGPGRYRVTWRLRATPLGRALTFTLPP